MERVYIGAREVEIDPLRLYNDCELRRLLGGIGRTTLWEIRRRTRRDGSPLLASSSLYPGGPRRTTAAQILSYVRYLDDESGVVIDLAAIRNASRRSA